MHILHPVTTLVEIILSSSPLTTVVPPFFGTTWTGLTHLESDIG
jgi:hypothetical protein